MVNKVEIAELFNVTYDKKTGDLFLNMKVTDPVFKQKILKNTWEKFDVKLIIEEKE